MALVGGGGAGNVAGSNPAGIGFGFNYIGDHAYAFSGPISTNNNETTLLSFTTGAHYIVATFQAQYFSDNNDVYVHKLKMDSQEVVGFEFNGSNNADGAIAREIIIPPFTKVVATAVNSTDTSSNNVGATIIGRVYA